MRSLAGPCSITACAAIGRGDVDRTSLEAGAAMTHAARWSTHATKLALHPSNGMACESCEPKPCKACQTQKAQVRLRLTPQTWPRRRNHNKSSQIPLEETVWRRSAKCRVFHSRRAVFARRTFSLRVHPWFRRHFDGCATIKRRRVVEISLFFSLPSSSSPEHLKPQKKSGCVERAGS